MARKYRSAWTQNNVLYAAPAVVQDQWTEIGQYVIEAGLYYTPGWGFSTSQSDADGRIFVKIMDDTATAVEIAGTIRIVAYTPDDLPIGVLFESRTEALNSSATDRTKQLPFPSLGIELGQDYKYKIFFKADRSDIIDRADCIVLIDITKISKAG